MKRKKLTNTQRWTAISELKRRIEILGYHERIKLIQSNYKEGILNIDEYTDLIDLTIIHKENGKIKQGIKRDPIQEENKINNIIIEYIMYREDYKYGYEKTIKLIANNSNLATKTIEGHITKNKKYIDNLIKHHNLSPEDRAELECELEWHSKRLKLGTPEDFEKKLSKEKNFVKIFTREPIDISKLIAKAFAEGLRPDKKINSKVKK